MSAPARVLLHAFSTFKLGGPQARFVQLAQAMGPRYRHLIVAMDGCFDAGERLGPDVRWEPLRVANQRGGALANRAAFRAVLAQVKPDLLLSYNWGAIEWAAANWPRCVPQVHVEDGFGPEEAHQQLPRRVWTRRVLLGWTGMPVVVPSQTLLTLARTQWRLPARRVQFIPNGVALPARVAPVRAETSQAAHPLTVGTVAGLRPEKNVARLIRAFAALRAQQPARLLIVGDGPERAALQALACELKVLDDVEFTGYLSNPLARLADMDVFALSSNTEQLPMAMLEAMAHGLPVVATRVGDVPAIQPAVAAQALSAVDDRAFEATLLQAVARRADWGQWALAGRTQVEQHYAECVMQTRWQQVFDGVWAPGTQGTPS